MKIVYESTSYRPELVTGRYVRCNGVKGSYSFRVFETATGTGAFKGKQGYGPTLREYDTDGAEIPTALKLECAASKQTHQWPF